MLMYNMQCWALTEVSLGERVLRTLKSCYTAMLIPG